MGYPTRVAIPVLTDAGGDASVTSGDLPFGFIEEVIYVPSASPLDTAQAVITIEAPEGFSNPVLTTGATEVTGTSVLKWAPRQPTHDVADATALLYAAAGEPVSDKIPVVQGDKIKVVISGGGNALSGTFYITVS